jgi:predicted TIM-barrel fold metal-dependent hydrolase
MMSKPRCPIIALEEHYWDEELASHFTGIEAVRDGEAFERLKDTGAWRLKEMDEAGVDVQVLSHVAPATQKLDVRIAVDLARRVNDRLAAAVRKNPARFAGFAALPTADPGAAADELERTVQELSFKGAMIHGHANGAFIDDKRFWPIFATAKACVCRKPRPLDLTRESLNVGRDGRADLPALEPGCLVLQAQDPT